MRTYVLTTLVKYVIIYVSMGVDWIDMKDIFIYISEILLSLFLIIFSYYVWSGIDQTDYNTAKYYDNIKEVQLVYDSAIDNNNVGNNIVLSIHNISNKKNNKDILFKINKNVILDNVIINSNNYNLSDIYYKEDEIYNYYLIEKAQLNGYETRVYFVDLISDNSIYDYEFITEA